MNPISRIGAPQVVYSNRFGCLMNDDVRGPRGDIGHYLRWSWANPGVVIVPFDGQRFRLWEMYRYPIGAFSLEFPRGASEPDEPVEAAAARELEEETGAAAWKVTRLGEVFADTGLIENPCEVVLAHLDPSVGLGAARVEPFEAIAGTVPVTPKEFGGFVDSGRIRCGLTIASYFLARTHLEATVA